MKKVNASALLIISIFLIINIILCGFNLIFNMDIALLGFYTIFLIVNIYMYRNILLKYLFMYVMFSYHVLSVFLVENYHIYFKNLLETSYRVGALAVLINFYMIYFGIIFFLEKNNESNNKKKSKSVDSIQNIKWIKSTFNKKNIKLITIILLIAIITVLLKKRNIGFYAMNGIDRFDYAALTFSWFDKKFYTYITWLLPIPLLAQNIGVKKIGNIFMFLYCFFMIWVGDKFGSLFIAFYIYILVIWMTKRISKKRFYQMVFICFVAITILMIFIALQVKYQWGNWSDIPTYFAHRLTGGQSDLWWKIYSDKANMPWRLEEFCKDELGALLRIPKHVTEYNFGIYKMMRVAAPASVVEAYLRRGIRFAASTQATLFYYFGYMGLYMGGAILAILGYWIVNRAVDAYHKSDMICSICYTMLLTKYISIMQMSEFRFLTNKTTLVAIVVLFIKYEVEKHKKKMGFNCD